MKIQITQDDIDEGKPNSEEGCALAICLLRELEAQYVSVSNNCVVVSESPLFESHEAVLKLPKVASDLIENFDAGNTVYPTEFELDLTDVSRLV